MATLFAKPLKIDDIAIYYSDTETSLRLYFSKENPKFEQRFSGYTVEELASELNDRIDELGRTASLSLLATLEASFRMDYSHRCRKRKKDPLSRVLRDIYKAKGNKASLEEDILDAWKENTRGATKYIGDLKGAYKYRHWLAHGRYWTPKMGRADYDYTTIYQLAEIILNNFPFDGL